MTGDAPRVTQYWPRKAILSRRFGALAHNGAPLLVRRGSLPGPYRPGQGNGSARVGGGERRENDRGQAKGEKCVCTVGVADYNVTCTCVPDSTCTTGASLERLARTRARASWHTSRPRTDDVQYGKMQIPPSCGQEWGLGRRDKLWCTGQPAPAIPFPVLTPAPPA